MYRISRPCVKSRILITALGLSLAVLATAPRTALAQTAEEVNRSIDRGIDFLKSRQRNGRWEEFHDYRGGITALAVLALLSCDVPPDDPVIVQSLEYLQTVEPHYTYVVALQTMVFATAKPKGYFSIVKRNAEWLMRTRLGAGHWEYPGRSMGDNSNTQFALLGLQAASEAGFRISDSFWERSRQYWIRNQSPVGSWGYTPSPRGASGSMTAAGIASLVITSQQLKSVAAGFHQGVPVRCDGPRYDKNLQMAIDWMGRNFSVSRNPSQGGGFGANWLHYYLYGLERAGRLDWPPLLRRPRLVSGGRPSEVASQRVDGAWNEGGGLPAADLFNTSFALLFLSKGRIPILVNKLQYGSDANGKSDWNKAPNDINNLTQFMAKVWNKRLNWQVVDVKVATVSDLLQAPVLHLSGHSAPKFTDREKKLLREFVEQGGLLVADANCGVQDFDLGFRQLCKELFPEPGQELRRLDAGHMVWSSLFPLQALANTWPLYGIEMGCRTGVFYSPDDLSCQWEHQDEMENQGKMARALAAFRVGANIIAYATGPEDLADKLKERKVYDKTGDEPIRRNFLVIPKVRHGGDWNPAPRAIFNLATALREKVKVDVVRQPREIDVLDPNFLNYPFSYMHGRTGFKMNKAERETIAAYLKGGGVLLADAACGNERFDEAFRALANDLFGDKKLKEIPLDHELFTDKIGYDIRKVKFTKALAGREGPPILEGIELDGRFVLVYSKYDIGCAMERQQGADCKGYTHESALKIATNVVLYALKQ